jgi:hypothetical protein
LKRENDYLALYWCINEINNLESGKRLRRLDRFLVAGVPLKEQDCAYIEHDHA